MITVPNKSNCSTTFFCIINKVLVSFKGIVQIRKAIQWIRISWANTSNKLFCMHIDKLNDMHTHLNRFNCGSRTTNKSVIQGFQNGHIKDSIGQSPQFYNLLLHSTLKRPCFKMFLLFKIKRTLMCQYMFLCFSWFEN